MAQLQLSDDMFLEVEIRPDGTVVFTETIELGDGLYLVLQDGRAYGAVDVREGRAGVLIRFTGIIGSDPTSFSSCPLAIEALIDTRYFDIEDVQGDLDQICREYPWLSIATVNVDDGTS